MDSFTSKQLSYLFPGYFGTDFLLAFPEGYSNITRIQVNIAAMTTATVKLTSPVPGVNNTITVDPSTGTAVSLPTSLAQKYSIKEYKYVHVESDNNISMTVVEYISNSSSDGYLAIPTNMLGKSYLFTNYNYGIISIVALYDNTHIDITETNGVYLLSDQGNRRAFLSFELSKLQSYQVRCSSWCMGYVNSSYPISVRYGSRMTSGYSHYGTSYVEGAILAYPAPVKFIVPMLSNSSSMIVICLAKRNMQIKSSHTLSSYLSGHYTYIQQFTFAQFITTNQSAICSYIGHGFSVTIPPVKAYTNYYRFLTPSVTNFTHHAAIMIRSSDKDGVRLDNSHPKFVRQETVIVDSMSYIVLYLNLTSGQHEITHINPYVEFGVILYGFGDNGRGSYAYPGGFKLT